MSDVWRLPSSVTVGGAAYRVNADFRDVLEVIRYLDDPNEPEYIRWEVALALFYEEGIPAEHKLEAMHALAEFVSCGTPNEGKPSPKLIDWEQDGAMIVADINKVAGTEIRTLPFLHWWTFVAFFHGIGEGQLSTIVSIRDKLRRGKKLEKWEQEFYRSNKARIDLKKRYSAEELAEQDRLKRLLGG